MLLKPRSSVFPRTFSEEESSTVIVGKAPPALEDVISGASTEKPFDLESFMRFAEGHLFVESLQFLTQVNALRRERNLHKYHTNLCHILDEFVRRDAPSQINLGHFERLKTEKHATAVLRALEKKPSADPDRSSLNAAYDSILMMVKNDKYVRYANYIMVQRQVRVSRLEALWWNKEGLTLREFATFPSPVNTSESRLHACLTVLTTVAASASTLYWGFPWLWLYSFYGFFARSLSGPRIDPQAFVVLFLLRPLVVDKLGLLRDEFVPGTPKRFAQVLGLVFSTASTVLAFCGYNVAMLTVAGVLILAAALWGFCNLCIACDIYMVLVRNDMLPLSICEDCYIRYVKGEGLPIRVKARSDPVSLRDRLSKSKSFPGGARRGVRPKASLTSITDRFSSRRETVSEGKTGTSSPKERSSRAVTLDNASCIGNTPRVVSEAHSTGRSREGRQGAEAGPQSTDSSAPRSASESKDGRRGDVVDGPKPRTIGCSSGVPRFMTPKRRKNTKLIEEYNKVFSQRLARDLNRVTSVSGRSTDGRSTRRTNSSRTYASSRTYSSRTMSDFDVEPAAQVEWSDSFEPSAA